MNLIEKMVDYFIKLNKKMKRWQRVVSVLSAVVVFVTTYALILPAITLDRDTATAEPGIEIAADENNVDESGTVFESEPESDSDAENAEDEEPAEDSSSESGREDADVSEEEADPAEDQDAAPAEEEPAPTEENEDAADDTADDAAVEDTAPSAEKNADTAASEDSQEAAAAAGTSAEEPAEETRLITEDTQLIYRGDDYVVYADFGESAKLPVGVTLQVREITKESDPEAYEDYYNKALAEMQGKYDENTQLSFARFYDIAFIYEETEVEPSGNVSIRIEYKKAVEAENTKNVDTVHFDKNNDENAAVIDSETKGSETSVKAVEFESDQFSVYGIVGTAVITTQFITAEGATYEVTVTYDENAGVPKNAQLVVSEVTEDDEKYDDYVNQAAFAIRSRAFDLDYIKLIDIKIMDENGNQVILDNEVNVQIKLLDKEQVEKTTQIVHFEGTEETPVVMDSNIDNDKVAFSTDGFSVYAVVNDGSDENEARATVKFFGKDTATPLAMIYVKNSDTLDELEEIICDPGCGQLDNTKKELFDGWVISTTNTTDGSSYTIETEGKTIEEVRQYLESLEIKEGDVVNIYAKIVRTITISYEGEAANTVIGTVVLKVLGSDDPNSEDNIAEYTINMAYTPATSTQAFMGWNVVEGASNILSATYNGENAGTPYQNGTQITVKGDVKLSVNAPHGHWLVFDENGHGATYNAPQFVKDRQITTEPPLEMERIGYSFGGWYKLKENADISQVSKGSDGYYIISDEYFETFAFGDELEDNLIVYAKWTAAETAHYTVIVWKERMTDTYAKNGGTGDGKKKNYDFAESYIFEGPVGQSASAVSNGMSSVVDGDDAGTRYNNARIQGTDASTGTDVNTTVAYTGYHCASYDKNVEVKPEGTSVVNVYYDRNTVTYTFYTYGTGSDNWQLCRQYSSTAYDGDIYKRVSNSGNRQYEKVDKSTISHDDGITYYRQISGGCSDGDMEPLEWVNLSGSSWQVYQKSTGLYGEKLSWPTDTSIWWYEQDPNTTQTGNTRMTYKDAFLPLDSDMTVEYYGTERSGNGYIHFWTQNLNNGDSYTDEVSVAIALDPRYTSSFSINDKFTGFYAYQYRADNGNWQNVGGLGEKTEGIYGDPVSYTSRLDIRYNRITASITFLDGAFFDGDGNPIEDETPQADPFKTTQEYFYGDDVSSYNKGGSDYYTPPEKAGYTFAGWYADDACTIEYDFGTMPASGITVYAKWIQNQYRVFLHPTVPETDTSLNWGSETQRMNFRISSGSKASVPTGTRTEYKFIGWYLDENCTEVFDASRFVLNDTTVTTPYNKSVDMTDVMNKYGNIEGTGSNSDATGYNGGDRFWITKKLDLYAKWRAELIGADGIGVKYDANGGSNTPSDTTLYLDNTDTVAQGASTAPDDTQQFLHWVMQKYDETQQKFVDLEGDEYKIYPGDSFTVLKANALVEELEGSTQADPKYRYTVQLRAEYGPKDTPTPTHLTWYANGGISADGTVDRYTDPKLQINEAVAIRPENTFKRDGYTFLGWARVDSTTDGYEIAPKNLTENDLFLKYEEGKFYAKNSEGEWTKVEKVAADEKLPYHDMYAVWEPKTYTVTVTKSVFGIDGDEEIPFTFTPSFTGLPGSDYTSAFQLVGKDGGADIVSEDEAKHYEHSKEFVNVPYGTVFTITEQPNDAFNVKLAYSVTGADNADDNVSVSNVSNGSEITVKGNLELTVNNTRKIQLIRIKKTAIDGSTPLGDAVFTVNVGGSDYTLTSDGADGFLKNDTFEDGLLTVPHGTYSLTEVAPPNGYYPLSDAVQIRVDGSGVHVNGYTVNAPTETENYYTIIIPNNPGVALPSTGGSGVHTIYLLGICLVMIAGALLIGKRRLQKKT